MLLIDIIDQDVFRAMSIFLKTFLPSNIEIVQAQDNRVPMPIGEFVAMNNVGMERLSLNTDSYQDQQKFILTPTKFEMQLDFYGPTSQVFCIETVSLFRDEIATEIFPKNIQPLYADDPHQMPLINGEDQYEQRWRLLATLQYNPILTTAQQSALHVEVGVHPIDQIFPI